MIKKIIKICVQILNILFIILSIALLIISIFEKEWFEIFIEWMKGVVAGLGMWNYLIVSASSFIEVFPVLGVLLPGQNILLIIGGFFGHDNYTHLLYVVIISTLGAIIGNYVGYFLGKIYGDSFFDKYGIRFGIGKTEVKYLKKGIDKWGAWGITVGKFHPMTRSFLPFIAGSMGMKRGKFMLYNAIGSFIRSATLILLGVVFVKYYKLLLEYSGSITLGILICVGGYIYFFKKEAFITYWEEKNAEIEAQANIK